MIKIFIPNNNTKERKYIIDVIFGEFLGLDYNVDVRNQVKDYEIHLPNKSKLIIKDFFFNNFREPLEYLKLKNISQKVEFAKNSFIVEDNIPILYGEDYLKTHENNKEKILICDIDIFATSFFMLTRWEEYVNKTRDKHNRFPAYASLSYKNNFLDRPIVNEYVEMLWNMLKYLGLKQARKMREFKYILTHDVDMAFKYSDKISMIRELAGDLIKRKNIKILLKNLNKQKNFLLGREKDPLDTYDYLMDISEKIGVKSHFFLHSSKSSKFDNNNDRFLKEIADRITKRGHYVGYHPSYNSYNNFELFIKDKERIENLIGQKLEFGRQHYLRFEVPTTWQIWEGAKMEWDSTMSYADKEGFRCGVCYPFSVFNILTRQKLNLKEKPLIVMEGSLTTYQNFSPEEMEENILKLIEKVKRYNGEFVFLWHNSSFNTSQWITYSNIYEKVLLK